MSRSPNTEHGFYGVTKVAEGRYYSCVYRRKPGTDKYRKIHLGSFPNAEYAAIARERYILEHDLSEHALRNYIKDTGVDLSRYVYDGTSTKTSQYKGVHWCKTRQKWGVNVWLADKKKTKILGYFEDEDTAMFYREQWLFNNGYLEQQQETEE